MFPADHPELASKLSYLRETIREIGKEEAVLKLSKRYSLQEISFWMDQLNGQSVAKDKFPFLASKENILYPPSYYLEQTSSEKTARFKASLVQGNTLIDMTGGFGIDTYFFSEKITETWYIEKDPVVYEIASRNLQVLNPAVKTACADSLQFVESLDKKVDWLYLDPIRRNKDRRLSRLEDYSPNIHEIQDWLFRHGNNVMIKLSPMTDISHLTTILGNKVSHVYVISVENECKELLILSDGKLHDNPVIESINWRKEKEERFISSSEDRGRMHPLPLSDPLQYLYEPNAAIFKAQQYDELAGRYSLFKLHANTHLYTSGEYHPAYEGRVYKIQGVYSFDAKSFRKAYASSSFNIKTRNFPMSAAEIAKKLAIIEGGELNLFCVRINGEKLRMIVCERAFDDKN